MVPREQIKFALKELQNAWLELASANMRLEGSKYESDMRKVMDAHSKLNKRLINDLK